MLTDFNWTRTQNHLVRKRTLNHLTKLAILAILAKWLSVHELSGCGLESSYSQLDFAPASSKEILDIQATIKCGFTLKRVSDVTKRYSHLKKEFFFNQLTNWLMMMMMMMMMNCFCGMVDRRKALSLIATY